MNLMELKGALKQLRLGGMAAVLETRLRQAQAEVLRLSPRSKHVDCEIYTPAALSSAAFSAA